MKSLTTLFGFSILLISFYGFSDKLGKGAERRASVVESGSEPLLSLDSSISKVILKTANGCGIGNFLIPSTGDTTRGTPPLLGSITENWPNYTYNVWDTVPGKHIKGVAFTRTWWPTNTSVISALSDAEPYVVVSDTGMFTYWFDGNFSPDGGNLYELDSLFIPGILKMAKQITTDGTGPIVLLTEDTISTYRIRVYSYPNLLEQFSFAFHFEPEIFEVIGNSLFITGWDTTGTYMLYNFNALQNTLYATYPLNDSASNAQEFLTTGDFLFVLSSPGDSMTVLTTLKATDSTLSQSVVYPQSGARATSNEYQYGVGLSFTFQPTASVLDNQILVLDPVTGQFTDTLMINLSLDWFKHPDPADGGFGVFSMGWMGARWENGINDSVFISDAYSTNYMRIEAGAFPKYINATYGCWVGTPENELEEIKFEVHPNPASSEAVISLTGLKKGRQYTLTITDMSGRVHYTTSLEAYHEIILPAGALSDGVYLLNLDTGRNIITWKLVVQ